MELIRQTVPGARFVLIVRDGRDVVASIANREGADFGGALQRWVSDNRRVLRARKRSDVHVLRYEDIVTNAQATIRKVCAFLDVPYDARMLHYYEEPANWFGRKEVRAVGRPGKEHGDLRNWQVNQPIFDGRGRWKKDLPAEFVARFKIGAPREIMSAFGYDLPWTLALRRRLGRLRRAVLAAVAGPGSKARS